MSLTISQPNKLDYFIASIFHIISGQTHERVFTIYNDRQYSDHLGSVRELVDTAGTVRARYDYDLYGKREKLSGDLDADFGFTGHYWHAETGLCLAPYRAYDPSLGRWISRDPLGELAGSNLYSYVLNNPISLWDPYGLDWLDTTSNFLGGFADSATFGLAAKAREGYLNALGIDNAGDGVDKCSTAYSAGEWTSVGLSLATGVGGAAKAAGGLKKIAHYELGQKWLPLISKRSTERIAQWASKDPVRNWDKFSNAQQEDMQGPHFRDLEKAPEELSRRG